MLHRAAFLVLFSNVYAVLQQPVFIENGNIVAAQIGRDAQLNCTVRNVGHKYKVAWLDVAREVILSMQDEKVSDNPRFSISHASSSSGVDSFILTVHKVTEEDEGTFMCQVNTKEALLRFYTLSIVVSPSIVDDMRGGDVEEVVGGKVILSCKANGIPPPKITWRRAEDDRESDEGNKTDSHKFEMEGETIVLENLRRQSAGVYYCIAQNGVSPAVSKRFRIHVKFRPLITVPTRSVAVYMGETAALSCHVEAWPIPYVHWTRESSQLRDSTFDMAEDGILRKKPKYETLQLKQGDVRVIMTLTVRGVQREDVEGYKCIANNTEGTSEAIVQLIGIHTTTEATTTTTKIPPTTTTAQTTTSTTPPFILVERELDKHSQKTRMPFYVITTKNPLLVKSQRQLHDSNQGGIREEKNKKQFSMPSFVFSSSEYLKPSLWMPSSLIFLALRSLVRR